MKKILIPCLLFTVACSSGLKIVKSDRGVKAPWHEPYICGMNGAENLAFDGEGNLFVTGLDGVVYKIVPTQNPYRGEIVLKKKLGKLCCGIAVNSRGSLFVAVADDDDERKIARMRRDFSNIEYVSGPIPGLNGMAMDSKDFLYYTSSRELPVCPDGKIYRVKTGDSEDFKNPEIIVEDAGIVNGLALSPDETILYYTETTGGLWSCDLSTGTKKQYYSPSGFLQILDDVTTDSDGNIWFCLNSEMLIVPVKGGKAEQGFRVGHIGAPSSCEFGKGRGFNSGFLYITELGLKGRSLTFDGRGVWVFPVGETGVSRTFRGGQGRKAKK